MPRAWAVCPPARTRRYGCGGLGAPPSRWLHLPGEAQAQKPPPPLGWQTGCRAPVLRGAPLTACPTGCPTPPPHRRIPAHLCLPCPPTRGEGGVAPCRGERGTTLPLTLGLSLTPLAQSSSIWLPLSLQYSPPCSTLLPQILPCNSLRPLFLEGRGVTWILPSPPCSVWLPLTQPRNPPSGPGLPLDLPLISLPLCGGTRLPLHT